MYFVVKEGLNYSDKRAQNLVCGGQYCNSDSVSTQIFIASKQSNRWEIYKIYIKIYFFFLYQIINNNHQQILK